MKKIKIVSMFTLLVLLLCMSIPAFAAEEGNPAIPEDRQLPLLHDSANILSDEEEAHLWEKLESISSEYQLDVAVVTVPSLEGNSVQAYADDFYDYNGYGYGEGYDGILLLLSQGDREAAITTHGTAFGIFTDARQDAIWDKMMPYLSSDDWNQAFIAFASHVESILVAENSIDFKVILITFVIGLLVALIVTGVMKSKLKTVHRQPAASEYIVDNSLNITKKSENFLYNNLVKTKKAQNSGGSSGHTSSSGRTHGGSSRKF